VSFAKAKRVLARYRERLLALEEVVGVGLGVREGKVCILVFVRHLTKNLEKVLPKRIEGVDVVIEEVGEIRAYG